MAADPFCSETVYGPAFPVRGAAFENIAEDGFAAMPAGAAGKRVGRNAFRFNRLRRRFDGLDHAALPIATIKSAAGTCCDVDHNDVALTSRASAWRGLRLSEIDEE